MLTEQAIDEFMTSRGGLRPSSQDQYRKHLALFRQSFTHLPKDSQVIQAWLNGFASLAPETINSRFRTVRSLYKLAHQLHPRVRDPMALVRPPPLKRKVMRTFADGELHRLFNLRLSARDSALITLFLDIGARAREVANLTWGDLVPGYAVLQGKTGKRVVPISETTYRQLEALKPELPSAAADQHVFLSKHGRPLSYDGIYYIVRHLCEQAGITGMRASPHTFRHTFGTNYAATEGCDVTVLQDILGHIDFKTTRRYIHNNPRRMAQNHQRCTPLKGLAAAAQGRLFGEDVVQEAEAIVARKRETDQAIEEPGGDRAGSSRETG